jgi:plastocyanin
MTGTRAQTRRTTIGAIPPARRFRLVILVCTLAVAVLAGCGSSGGSSSSGSTSSGGSGGAASSAVITIKDFAFTTPASVSPGATVSVHNMDSIAHSVTADDGKSFDSPAQPGDSSFKAPTTPGSYTFHCTPHPEMHGTLVVK